jgi:hypothetical protein
MEAHCQSSLRVSVEHLFSEIGKFWPIVRRWESLKVFTQNENTVTLIYKSACLLKNFHSCLRGNIFDKYNLITPRLEEYCTKPEDRE